MNKKQIKKTKGQVVVEYILLLLIVVAAALSMVQLVDVGDLSDPNSGGSLIKYWKSIIRAIGEDL